MPRSRSSAGQDWADALKATDLALTPAACYPLYPLAASRVAVPAAGLKFDVESYYFRHELRSLNDLRGDLASVP